jgi:hypothetical protein
MLQWKASNRISDITFDELLLIVKDMLPEGNEFLVSTYEAKRIVCPLGLEVEKIHACPNDCILYQGKEYEKLETCPLCEAQRYKIDSCEGGVVFSSDTTAKASIQVLGQCKDDVLAQRRT